MVVCDGAERPYTDNEGVKDNERLSTGKKRVNGKPVDPDVHPAKPATSVRHGEES